MSTGEIGRRGFFGFLGAAAAAAPAVVKAVEVGVVEAPTAVPGTAPGITSGATLWMWNAGGPMTELRVADMKFNGTHWVGLI